MEHALQKSATTFSLKREPKEREMIIRPAKCLPCLEQGGGPLEALTFGFFPLCFSSLFLSLFFSFFHNCIVVKYILQPLLALGITCFYLCV